MVLCIELSSNCKCCEGRPQGAALTFNTCQCERKCREEAHSIWTATSVAFTSGAPIRTGLSWAVTSSGRRQNLKCSYCCLHMLAESWASSSYTSCALSTAYGQQKIANSWSNGAPAFALLDLCDACPLMQVQETDWQNCSDR